MCKYKYFVRLTPIDTYFFGGESTFGDNTKQNYYVRSNKLPQVSTLLGAMRYEVLRQNNLLFPLPEGTDPNKVKELIGSKGFDMTDSTYGVIESISPLFLEKSGIYYTPMPLDEGINVEKTDIKCSFSLGTKCKVAYAAEKYDMKHYDNYEFWTDKNKNKINESDIFYQKEQVGITKNGKSDDDKDAYYKIITYGLKLGYNFVFMLTTSKEIKETDTIAYLGGNRSAFKMQITEMSCQEFEDLGESFTTYFSPLKREGRYLLLGDAFFKDDELDNLPFFWAQSICNRYIVTLYTESVKWSKPTKTAKLFRLLGRGGVIYSKEKPNAAAYLKRVGLNIFI